MDSMVEVTKEELSSDGDGQFPITRLGINMGEGMVYVEVIYMNQCAQIWIGSQPAGGSVVAAMPPVGSRQTPVSSSVVGGNVDADLEQLAQRLSMRTGWQIFVSGSVPQELEFARAIVEKELRKILPAKPVN
eukprot:Clim_evm5s226 gene=Clim_evmTU5s226